MMVNLHHEGFTQNREISWLRFNERVLLEANDDSVPLVERLKFIRIFSNNLDEFFMTRIGKLLELSLTENERIDVRSGLTPSEQLEAIFSLLPKLYKEKEIILNKTEDELKKKGIVGLKYNELSQNERLYVEKYYKLEIKEKLEMKVITKGKGFPNLVSKKKYLLGELSTAADVESRSAYALLKIPDDIPKLIPLSNLNVGREQIKFISLIDILESKFEELVVPFKLKNQNTIQITRNAEFSDLIEDYFEDEEDFKDEIKGQIEKRKIATTDILGVKNTLSEETKKYLCENLGINSKQIVSMGKDYGDKIIKELEVLIRQVMPDRANLFLYKKQLQSNQLKSVHGSIIDEIIRQDVASFFPYNSIDFLIGLLEEASFDKRVKAIKMTIYRFSSNATIADCLIKAAKRGKRVSVLIELRARFDEENNIDLAEKLEKAGCKVFYGSPKYKTHAKTFQIELEERDEECYSLPKTTYITQVGTGNFNEDTAKLYTDISLFTYNQRIGKEVALFFEEMKNGEPTKNYTYIMTSPVSLQKKILQLIDREIEKGEEGRIFFKVNSVTDPRIIEKLADASSAGVKVRMIVRGICCILPNIEFNTENVNIVSVVGRYLEHSRVYCFGSGIDEKIYIASADLMTRNTMKRMELACPIYDSDIKKKIKRIMALNYKDNVKGRRMRSDGTYATNRHGDMMIDSQKEIDELI